MKEHKYHLEYLTNHHERYNQCLLYNARYLAVEVTGLHEFISQPIRNEIRIYPIGIGNDNEHWKIGVNIGPYQRWEKQNVSPSIYDKHTIWPEYYRMCKYYYDKRIRKEI